VRNGLVVYDLNGMSGVPWEKVPPPAPRKNAKQ
jgi:hypothetical protein